MSTKYKLVAFGGGAEGGGGKTTIPNPSSVRWTWAEWSGRANPNTNQWTPPLMTWKRRSKKSLRKLGKLTPPVLLQMRHGNLLSQPNINLSHLGEVPARAEGGLKLDKTTIPNPSSVRWTWAEWSGKENPNTNQWTPPLMTWKRRSKRLLRRLGKPSPPPVLLQMRHGNLLCQPNINLSHLGEVPARAEGVIEIGQDHFPNPSSVRWTWAEWSGKANPNTKQWTPPLMTWKRRSKSDKIITLEVNSVVQYLRYLKIEN